MTEKPLKMPESFPGYKLVEFKAVSGSVFFCQFLNYSDALYSVFSF